MVKTYDPIKRELVEARIEPNHESAELKAAKKKLRDAFNALGEYGKERAEFLKEHNVSRRSSLRAGRAASE